MGQRHDDTARRHDEASTPDATFKRHGPEPPENDSGPSQTANEIGRETDDTEGGVRNVTPDQQVD